jgi:hypothetical protein
MNHGQETFLLNAKNLDFRKSYMYVPLGGAGGPGQWSPPEAAPVASNHATCQHTVTTHITLTRRMSKGRAWRVLYTRDNSVGKYNYNYPTLCMQS